MYTWKNGAFTISFPFPLYQGSTISLSNWFTLLVDFIIACKRLWCLLVLAGSWDSKTQTYTTEVNAESA